MNEIDEIWVPVGGYETLYEVSSAGRVRSLPRVGRGKRNLYGGKIVKSCVNSRNGYAYLTLCDDISSRKRKRVRVHVMVAQAFIGPCPLGQEVRHGNGARHDNVIENLSYATHRENCADKVAHGTSQRGERHPMSRLSDSQALDIANTYNSGSVTQTELAEQYGVSQAAIWFIVSGKRKMAA